MSFYNEQIHKEKYGLEEKVKKVYNVCTRVKVDLMQMNKPFHIVAKI